MPGEKWIINTSSFRDPSGYIFEEGNQLYRYVDQSYRSHFDFLTQSGLLEKLFNQEQLVRHEIVKLADLNDPGFVIIKPDRLSVITYPYEWSFSQLKEASLLTLDVLKQSLEFGMILKDASAFNIQFKGCKPIFIDTLSFAIYEEGQPWYGYRQFCEHFVAPLCLFAMKGVAFQPLLRLGVEGINLKMVSRLLPFKSWFTAVPLLHIHLHAKAVERYSQGSEQVSRGRDQISKHNLLSMIDHLRGYIQKLNLSKHEKTQWHNYNTQTHYSEPGKKSKAEIIKKFVEPINPDVVWDIGANDGQFSRHIVNGERVVLALDSDPLAVERNFHLLKDSKIETVYPLIFDVMNPTPDLGWANRERDKLNSRSKPGLVMALAIIHHLAITNNVPFEKVAEYFQDLSEWLIIEWVPQEDEKIKYLPDTAGKKLYNRKNFEKGFFSFFELMAEETIMDSNRSILLLKRR